MTLSGGSRRVTARAWANLALCKYWGKLPGDGNRPATPSIGLALEQLATTTTVTRTRGADGLVINGRRAAPRDRARIAAYLDLWRERGLLDGNFKVESTNGYPTAAGLASSAGGFAALAAALNVFTSRPLGTAALSRLARRGSGSAARSIPGGLSSLPTGDDPAARQLLAVADVPWWMVVVVMDTGAKAVGSREAMELSRRTSPYYAEWLKQAAADYRRMRKLIPRGDLNETGPLVEANMLAMHACIQAARPAPLYWTTGTVAVLDHLRRWRTGGLNAWATIDAGPHVAVLCNAADAPGLRRRLMRLGRGVAGIADVLASPPAGSPEILSVE